MKTIETLGTDFTKRHEWLLSAARSCEVAICGGCAAAIVKQRTDYVPADLDLVTTKANALRFVDQINHFLIEKQVHYRIYVNSHNDFVPEPALSHFRIQSPFWTAICLFVLPHDKFNYYRIKGGHLLQLPKDIRNAANELTKIDEKPRLANDLLEDDILEEEELVPDEPSSEYYERPEPDPFDSVDVGGPISIETPLSSGSFRTFNH